MMVIREAKIQRRKKFQFDGRELRFNMNCGIFTTVTPNEYMRKDIRELCINLYEYYI